MDDFEDIVERLPELAEIEIEDEKQVIYVTIECVVEDDDFHIVGTNADSQEELVWLITGMLTEFAIGTVDYCPELDVDDD